MLVFAEAEEGVSLNFAGQTQSFRTKTNPLAGDALPFIVVVPNAKVFLKVFLCILQVVLGLGCDHAGQSAKDHVLTCAIPARDTGKELMTPDPIATAAGATSGVIVSETLHQAVGQQAKKACASGYDLGKDAAEKQQYWLYVSM